jgi:hypothetical protein
MNPGRKALGLCRSVYIALCGILPDLPGAPDNAI